MSHDTPSQHERNGEKNTTPSSHRNKTIFLIVTLLLLFPIGYFIYSHYQAEKEEQAKIAAQAEAELKKKKEAERIAKEEAERKAKEEAERIAKEEAERKAKEEAERIAKEEAERKAKEEAERIAKEEAERKAKEEAERIVKEEAKRKAEAERIAKINEKENRRQAVKRRGKKSGINIDLIDTPEEQRAKAIEYLEYQNITPQEYGAYMRAACGIRGDSKLLINILGAGADVNEQDEKGCTILHHAVRAPRNARFLTALILDAGADVNISDNDGYTPLHSATLNLIPSEGLESFKLLLSCPDIDVNKSRETSGTPLHCAISQYCTLWSSHQKWRADGLNYVKLLLAVPSIDVNATTDMGYTPLHEAANSGNIECVQLLLSMPSININKKDRSGYTPLGRTILTLSSHAKTLKLEKALKDETYDKLLRCISLLIKAGSDVNNASESSLLHLAVRDDIHECLKLLLSAPGVDVNKEDDQLGTALLLAALNGSKECVKLLLKTPGIDVNKGWAFMTPYRIAVDRGHKEIAELIRAAGGK